LSALLEVLPRLDSNPQASSADLTQGLTGVVSSGGAELLARGGPRSPAISAEVGIAAWDLVDMDRYRAVWRKAHGYFSLNMAASRGCPFRCTWCAKPIWGNQYLQRNATEVALEMAFLKRSFHPDHIWFADDIFGFRVDWVAEFAAAVRAADASIPFSIQTRADLMSERMAEALREAGCKEAWIGAESGSQRVLDAMSKGTTVAEIRVARDRLKAVGIRVGFFIQLGYMGEELDDILATRALLEASRPDEIGVSVSYPLPGTKFYELVKAQLGGKTHWRESDDLDMMFHGTYTSDFYRCVRNLMHDQVSLQSGAMPTASGEHRRVQQALDRRWQDLLSQELNYRSPPARAVLTG
jgi:anaerobic magnesium-protoporphyrin IX monomethyl ester cyclase